MSNPLQQLGEHGQSVWLDYISRELVETSQLNDLMTTSNITGLTSNPTIFEKSIGESDAYDDRMKELLEQGVTDPMNLFLSLGIHDIRRALDELRTVWDQRGGADGFASFELLPAAAHDTVASIEMAHTFWDRIDRPNLMVKVPATDDGIPAIQQLIADGINVNVTLIFALDMYDAVIEAYICGLEKRFAEGQSLDVHSVASFFVSRVDTATDKLIDSALETDPGNKELDALHGKAAIANARLAYELFEQRFRHSERWAKLEAAGAHLQRPLWASTSAKNPKYRDVIYAEALIGPDTVDTMPPATIEAFRDHGIVDHDTVYDDWAAQREVVATLAKYGIDINRVTADLLSAGVQAFTDSYDSLIATLQEKASAVRSEMHA